MDLVKMLEFYEEQLTEEEMILVNDVGVDKKESNRKIQMYTATVALVKKEISKENISQRKGN